MPDIRVDEFRARLEAELLDEDLTPKAAGALAAAADTSDVSDAAFRRIAGKLLREAPSAAFAEGTEQRKQRFYRELREKLMKERASKGDPIRELDRRLEQQDELSRRVERLRRN
jgi:hypothetical protein